MSFAALWNGGLGLAGEVANASRSGGHPSWKNDYAFAAHGSSKIFSCSNCVPLSSVLDA